MRKVCGGTCVGVTSGKRPARTHFAHLFERSFRTHTHTCDCTSHVCVRARTFATHTLIQNTFHSIIKTKHQILLKKIFVDWWNKLVNWCHEEDTIHFFSAWQLKRKSLKSSLIRNSRFLSFFNWEVLLISFRFLFGEFVIIWARYTCINSSENL